VFIAPVRSEDFRLFGLYDGRIFTIVFGQKLISLMSSLIKERRKR
jgi:hypothetical protein